MSYGIKQYKNRSSTHLSFIVVVVVVLSFNVIAKEQKEYEMINITAGQVGILDDTKATQRYGLEYRFKSFSGPFGFRLIPAVGAAIANDSAHFIYADIRHDFYLSRRWILIPSFGLGIFKDSSKINLGNNLEFRSGVELAYQFKNKVRAGVAIFHLSNGGISSQNPGTEALVFSICIPVLNE
jgi:hypothetical protein